MHPTGKLKWHQMSQGAQMLGASSPDYNKPVTVQPQNPFVLDLGGTQGTAALLWAEARQEGKGTPAKEGQRVPDTYETHAKGIRILPGQWRPHYPWEQIAWVSPAWPCQDYLWLDFPEAIFTNQGLLYLSAVNPKFPVVFPDLPKAPWRTLSNGLTFERRLPNGVRFGGSVVKRTDTTVGLELFLENGSPQPLTDIKLQTCAYLRAIKEFADFTNENKFVHLPDAGWLPWHKAVETQQEKGRYRLGWRGGPALADLPVMVTVSNQAQRLVAMTWFADTLSLINNPRHPCMHADPKFKDLAPGEKSVIQGEIIFFEGTLEQFEAHLKKDGRFLCNGKTSRQTQELSHG